MAVAALSAVARGAGMAARMGGDSKAATDTLKKQAEKMRQEQQKLDQVHKHLRNNMEGSDGGSGIKDMLKGGGMDAQMRRLLSGGDKSVEQVARKMRDDVNSDASDSPASRERKRKASGDGDADQKPAKKPANRDVTEKPENSGNTFDSREQKRKASGDEDVERPAKKPATRDVTEKPEGKSEEKPDKPETEKKGKFERISDAYNNWQNMNNGSGGSDKDPAQVIMDLLVQMAPSSEVGGGGGGDGGQKGNNGPGMMDQMAMSHVARKLDGKKAGDGSGQKSTGKDVRPPARSIPGKGGVRPGRSATSRGLARSENTSRRVKELSTEIRSVRPSETERVRAQPNRVTVTEMRGTRSSETERAKTQPDRVPATEARGTQPSETERTQPKGFANPSLRLTTFFKAVEQPVEGSTGRGAMSREMPTGDKKAAVAMGRDGKPLPSMKPVIERSQINGDIKAGFTDAVSRNLEGRNFQTSGTSLNSFDVTRGAVEGQSLVRTSRVSLEDPKVYSSITDRLYNPDNYNKTLLTPEKASLTPEKASLAPEKTSPENGEGQEGMIDAVKVRGALREDIILGAEMYGEAKEEEAMEASQQKKKKAEQNERDVQVRLEEEQMRRRWGEEEGIDAAYEFGASAIRRELNGDDSYVQDSGYETVENREGRRDQGRYLERGSMDRWRESEYFDEDGEPLAPGEVSRLSEGEQPLYLRDADGEELAYVERWDRSGRRVLVPVSASEMGVISLEKSAVEGEASDFREEEELSDLDENVDMVASMRDSGYVTGEDGELEESGGGWGAQGRYRERGSMDQQQDGEYFDENGHPLAPEEMSKLSVGERPFFLRDADGVELAYVERWDRSGRKILVPIEQEEQKAAMSLRQDAVEGEASMAHQKSMENVVTSDDDSFDNDGNDNDGEANQGEQKKTLRQRLRDSVNNLNRLYMDYQMLQSMTGAGAGDGIEEAERGMMSSLQRVLSSDGGDERDGFHNYNQAMEARRRRLDEDEDYDADEEDEDEEDEEDRDVFSTDSGEGRGRRAVM